MNTVDAEEYNPDLGQRLPECHMQAMPEPQKAALILYLLGDLVEACVVKPTAKEMARLAACQDIGLTADVLSSVAEALLRRRGNRRSLK